MTQFVKKGNTFIPADEANLDIWKKLPTGNYVIKQDPFENFYFETVEKFTLGTKIYGDTLRNVDRMLNTFNDRPNSTGVLLAGEKGSGKTLLAKALSVKAAEQDIPTIIINTPFNGDKFNTLIQSINQPCVILFDEFEKVYEHDQQAAVLTLLDGVFPSKKLFVLTCNDSWRIDEHMRNRPGRIFYMLNFKGLAVEFITEYCEENLKNKSQIKNVCQVSTMFSQFNFDLLKALVEEMNRYDETAQEAIKLLNAKPQAEDGGRYKVELRIGGKLVPENRTGPKVWSGNPLAEEEFSVTCQSADYDDDELACIPAPRNIRSSALGKVSGSNSATPANGRYFFSYKHLQNVDPSAGTFYFVNDQDVSVKFTKIVSNFQYHSF